MSSGQRYAPHVTLGIPRERGVATGGNTAERCLCSTDLITSWGWDGCSWAGLAGDR